MLLREKLSALMLIGISVVYLIFPVNANAKEQIEYVIGVEDVNYFPLFNFNSKHPNQPSFAFDLLTAFFEYKQYKYRFVPLPIKRFDKWLIDHNIDFKFPDNMRWRADGGKSVDLTFSEPLLRLLAGTYVHKSKKDLTRLDVKTLMTIRGFYPTLWLDLIAANKVELHEEPTPVSIVRHLLIKNVQATNIDENVIRYQLKKLNKSGEIVLAKNIFHEQYTYNLSTNTYPEIIRAFNEFVKQEKQLIQSLKQKYEIKDKWEQ